MSSGYAEKLIKQLNKVYAAANQGLLFSFRDWLKMSKDDLFAGLNNPERIENLVQGGKIHEQKLLR